MIEQAPVVFHGAMRAGAAGARRRRLPLVVLGVELDEPWSGTEPEALQRECVSVGMVVHPLLDAVLVGAGCTRRGRGSYTASLDQPAAVDAVLAALPPACTSATLTPGRSRRATAQAELSALLAPVESAACAQLLEGLSERRTSAQRASGGWGVLSIQRRQLQLRVLTEEVVLGDEASPLQLRQLSVRGSARVRCTPRQAEEIIEAAAAVGIATAELGGRARWSQLRQLGAKAVVVEAVPGAPALARLATPELVEVGGEGSGEGSGEGELSLEIRSRSERELPAAEAMAEIAMRHLSAPLALAEEVLDAADIAVAGPAGRAGLHPYQDHFVSCYLAAPRGLVNALEPGMGKTVCAAAALAERAGAALRAGRAHRSLVIVPAGLREQWRSELGRFHPEAKVQVCERGEELEAAIAVAAAGEGAHVVVCSHELLTRSGGRFATGIEIDDVVLDEAAVLRSPGARRDALWQVRTQAQRGLALTGTPVERDVADLGHVLAWALGADPTSYPQAVSARHREHGEAALATGMGDTVFRRPRSVLGERMPEVVVDQVGLTPSASEADILERARAHVHAAAARAETARSAQARGELLASLSLARAASCDPASLSPAQRTQLGGETAPELRSTKRDWLLELCRTQREEGRQTLVTCDLGAAAVGVHALLVAAGIETRILSGRTELRERAGMVAAFQAGEVEVLVLTSVGRLGLNLQAASTVVSYDVPPNVAAARQRVARAARIGASATEGVRLTVPVLETSSELVLARAVLPLLTAALQAEEEVSGLEGSVGVNELTLAWAGVRGVPPEARGGRS